MPTLNELLVKRHNVMFDMLDKAIASFSGKEINYCDDLKKLKKLLRQAASIKTIDELDI